jgi:hypothetical protein
VPVSLQKKGENHHTFFFGNTMFLRNALSFGTILPGLLMPNRPMLQVLSA